MPNRRTLLAAAAAVAASACAAPPAWATGSLVDVQVVDRARNETLPTWRHRGSTWVRGRPGDRYAVRLTNRSAARVLVVLSVDGVNAVSGETASVGQTGYVLAPWQSTEITGWRKSQQEAAAFYFTSLPDSYAARTDRPDNVGVIGAAVFRERVRHDGRWDAPQPPIASRDAARDNAAGATGNRYESERSIGGPSSERGSSGSSSDRNSSGSSSEPRAGASEAFRERRAEAPRSAAADAAAPSAAARPAPRESIAQEAKKLGTGHGEREWSPTTQTTFERASSQPAEIVQVRYDSYANLVAAGVIPQRRPWTRQPDAFPGFVPDPT